MSGAGVAEGFIGGTAVIALQKAAQEIGERMELLPPKLDAQQQVLDAILAATKAIQEHLTHPELADLEETITLTASPVKLFRMGRAYYSLLYAGAAALNVSVYIVGIGNYAAQLQPGWNNLDFPDGTEITTSAGPVNVYRRASNTKIGEAI